MLVELLKLLSFVLIDFLFLTLLLIPGLTFVGCVLLVGADEALRLQSLWEWKEASRITLGVLLGLRNLARPWLDCQCLSSRFARRFIDVGSLFPALGFLYWICQCLYLGQSHPSASIVAVHSTQPDTAPSLENSAELPPAEEEKARSTPVKPYWLSTDGDSVSSSKPPVSHLQTSQVNSSTPVDEEHRVTALSSGRQPRLLYNSRAAPGPSSRKSEPLPAPTSPTEEPSTSRASSLQYKYLRAGEDHDQDKAYDRHATDAFGAVQSPPISPKMQPPSHDQELQPLALFQKRTSHEDAHEHGSSFPSEPTHTLVCEQPLQDQSSADENAELDHELSPEEEQWCQAEVGKGQLEQTGYEFWLERIEARWGDTSTTRKRAIMIRLTDLEMENAELEMEKVPGMVTNV